MNEKEILLSRAADLKEKAADDSVITFTNFLSTDEISIVSALNKSMSKYVDTFYFGGYSDAERCVAFYVPKFFECEDIGAFLKESSDLSPICLIKITKDKFCALSHRDYLGSIMGLGIKREMIGDILVDDDGCFLFALKSISKYICENLNKIGRGTVECHIVDVDSFHLCDTDVKELFLSLSSLRLDNVVAGAFCVSRGIACDEIRKGTVYVNSIKVQKNDFIIKEGDKIVLRGKGKAVLSEITGESKKGRLHTIIKRYK